MKRIRTISLALAVIISGASYASGQSLFIGGQAGLSMQKPAVSEIGFSTDTSYLYGLFVGIRVSSLALELNYFQAAHDLKGRELIDPWADRTIDYSYLGANFMVFIPLPLVQPYLTGGYGRYRGDVSSLDSDSGGGFNFGAGVELRLGDHFALRGEGRYHHVNLDITKNELRLGNFTLIVGVNIYLI